MKIKRIELYQIDLPYSGGVYHLSGGREYRSFDASIVKIIADNGLEGWGEKYTIWFNIYCISRFRCTCRYC